MESPESTCWAVVRGAASGVPEDRETFARRYAPVVRAYLAMRWAGTPHAGQLDDAVQEVFLDCFKSGGALERADDQRPGGFRAFLYGVTRMVALRLEARRGGQPRPDSESVLEQVPADDESLSRAFDRSWAQMIVGEALARQIEGARAGGERALRRVELLRKRFYEDVPPRDLVVEWGVDAAVLHRELYLAKKDFMAALEKVLAENRGTGEVRSPEEIGMLLTLLA